MLHGFKIFSGMPKMMALLFSARLLCALAITSPAFAMCIASISGGALGEDFDLSNSLQLGQTFRKIKRIHPFSAFFFLSVALHLFSTKYNSAAVPYQLSGTGDYRPDYQPNNNCG